MTRNPDRAIARVENVVADLHDPESVTAALEGVDAAFLSSPSAPDAARLQMRFADLSAAAKVG